MIDINSRIRQLRKEKKLTQKEFCKLTGASQSHLSEIENGKGNPTSDMLIAIAINLKNVSLRWLLAGENAEEHQNSNFNKEVLREVIEIVEWALGEVQAKPEPKKKADLIMAVYDFYLDEGVPKDRDKLINLVKAVA